MKKNTVKLNENTLRKIVAESVKSCDDFYNYVIKRFNEESIEVGDAGDAEELYQGCSNYDYETVPFEQLYQEVKNDWLSYKSEQKQYHGINENTIRKIVADSVKKVLKEGFYKDKEDKSEELTKKILDLRSNAIQLYEFIQKGSGIWGYRVGDSEEQQQERLELAGDIVRAINRLYKSVNEADFNDAERWNKFGV